MELQNRRRVGVLIRIGLIICTFVFVGVWIVRRVPKPPENVSVQREAPPASALRPGDLQIISTDGKVDLILQGDKIMGGLSPATVQEIRDKMAKETAKESTGLGGMISGIVKSSVASAIGTHVTYPVAEITSIRFDDGKLMLKVKSEGNKQISLGDDKGDKSTRFSKADGDRFVEAVKARKKELGLP